MTHAELKQEALKELNRALRTATDTGLFDDIAAQIHPDIINQFCDGVADFTKLVRCK